MRAMLELRQIACQRGDRLLFRRLALNLAPGGLLRVLGDNGVGKTSLLRMMAGLLPPTSGEILWQGQALAVQRDAFNASLHYLGHASATHERLDALEKKYNADHQIMANAISYGNYGKAGDR